MIAGIKQWKSHGCWYGEESVCYTGVPNYSRMPDECIVHRGMIHQRVNGG